MGYDEYHSGEAKALRGVRLINDYTFSIAVYTVATGVKLEARDFVTPDDVAMLVPRYARRPEAEMALEARVRDVTAS